VDGKQLIILSMVLTSMYAFASTVWLISTIQSLAERVHWNSSS